MASRRLVLALSSAVLILGALPSGSAAYQVTVNVHGAGTVTETTTAGLMNCSTGMSGISNTTTTSCVAGTLVGDYGWGWTVALDASVPPGYAAQGWTFEKWVDSSASGKINCDPQGTTGDHTQAACQFLIVDNLSIDLYFRDVIAPDTSLSASGPTGITNSTAPTFFFDSADPNRTFECKLDPPGVSGSFLPCGSGSPGVNSVFYSGLTANGPYTFSVRAKDLSGNTDATWATRTWTVDTIPPIPSIASGPGNPSNSTSASFSFSAIGAVAFECKLDVNAFSGCAGSSSYSSLAEGSHTFTVKATDAATNSATTSRTWLIDTTAPNTTITANPTNPTNSTSASFSFSSTEAGTFECSLDGAAYSTCTSPQAYSGLSAASHTFNVRATDTAGNTDSTPETLSWTIVLDVSNPIAPLPVLDGDADGVLAPLDCNDANAAVRPGAVDTPGDGIDQDCNGADAPLPPVAAKIAKQWAVSRKSTIVRSLMLSGLSEGAVVTVKCRGRGCAFKVKTLKANSQHKVDVGKYFKRKALRPGALIEIRITAPGMITKVVTFKTRAGKSPSGGKLLCLPPGATQSVAC